MAPGKLRLKQGGGHAGHNGLKDIERAIGSRAFWRLRLGIGHPGVRELVTPYVLGKPTSDESSRYDDAIALAVNLMPALLAGHMQQVSTQLR